ncbi:MAG: hypothetical protein ACTSYI_08815 [Promethearchaeota archaeon]
MSKQLEDNIIITLRQVFDKDKKSNYYHILDFDIYLDRSLEANKYKEILPKMRKLEKMEFLKVIEEDFIQKIIKEEK